MSQVPAPSPSEFLTFYRRLSLSSSRAFYSSTPPSRAATSFRPVQAVYARQFSHSSRCAVQQYPNDLSTNEKTKIDQYPDDKHATRKVAEKDHHNIQEASVKAGMDAKKNGTGGHATEQRDSAGGKSKAKQEFPEAPDPAIGMQDERGGRGA